MSNATNNITTEAQAQEWIKAQWKRRTDLIESEEFRLNCIEVMKKMGISAKEWNENMAGLLMFMANEVCGMEDKMRHAQA